LTTSTNALQELAEIRTLARDFARAEIRPNVEHWDHDAVLPDSLVAQLAELGFLGMLVAEEHGGMGFDAATFAAAVEELAWGDASVAALVVAHAAASAWLSAHGGSDAGEMLSDLAAGEKLATCSVLPGHLGPHARGGGAAHGSLARWLARPAGATIAVVPAGDRHHAALLEGAEITPHATMGLRALAIGDARLAAGSAIAETDAGVDERIALLGAAAIATGIAAAALDHAREYAAVREQFGRAIRHFEGIAAKLGEMHVRVAAARALALSAAVNQAPCAAARVFAADAAMWVTTQAVQIFGGYGYMRDYPVEKLMRDAKAAALLFGDNDALRSALADSLYRG
jgi:acyl-CoA dehydrogenase